MSFALASQAPKYAAYILPYIDAPQHAHEVLSRRFRVVMKRLEQFVSESGKVGYALLWLLGVPLPILLIIYLIRGH